VIDESDLLVEVRRDVEAVLSGGEVDPAVRVTHVPTGLVVVSEALETQVANRAAAIEELERLLGAQTVTDAPGPRNGDAA
jgi:protein subunit release factor A